MGPATPAGPSWTCPPISVPGAGVTISTVNWQRNTPVKIAVIDPECPGSGSGAGTSWALVMAAKNATGTSES